MIGNYAASGVNIEVFKQPYAAWVRPDGNDSTGQFGSAATPFRTLNAAVAAAPVYSATVPQGVIYISSCPVLTAPCNVGDVVIDRPISIIGLDGLANGQCVFFEGSLIISNTNSQPILIENLIFYNSAVDKPCIDITQLMTHGIRIRKCYLRADTSSKISFRTSGTAATSANTEGAKVYLDDCILFNKLQFGMGTAGNPFDKKGMAVISNTKRIGGTSKVASYNTMIEVNAGNVSIIGNPSIPPITVNGGIVYVKDSVFPWADSNDKIIIASPVSNLGDSFIILENISSFSQNYALSQSLKIDIGSKVVYSIKDMQLKIADLTIDANAQELNTYLGASAKVNYNSGPVYRAGTNIA